MSRCDRAYVEYNHIFNRKYGSGNSRRNVEIYIPIVQNFTFPLNLYDNGYIDKSDTVKKFEKSHSVAETMLEDGKPTAGKGVFNLIDTNPNFKGEGRYMPEEGKYTPLVFELPEFSSSKGTRLIPPAKSTNIPLDIRRQAFV